MTEILPLPEPSRFPPLDDQYLTVADPAATMMVRICSSAGRYPTTWRQFRHYGPVPSARFDHHPTPKGEHPDHGVMYLAVHDDHRPQVPALDTAVAEVFQDRRVITPFHPKRFYLAAWAPVRPLRLLNLVDSPWLTKAGGNAAISAGPHAPARAWARAIHDHSDYQSLDGLLYPSSVLPGGRCAVLWSGRATLPDQPDFNESLDHRDLRPDLTLIADRIGYSLDLVSGSATVRALLGLDLD